MTIKEAIMLLNPKTTASALAEIEYYNGFSGKEACIEAIEDACRLAIEALEKQATTQATSEWIPVSERLPEGENEVLVTVSGKLNNITFDNAIEIGFYCVIDGWIINGYLDWTTPEVTAWMELPESYKGESK